MSSAFRSLAIIAAWCASTVAFAAGPPLHVCSDPNNLPFSNVQQQGFENELARMVGHDLQREVQFLWWPPRARFREKWLKAQRCDLVMGTTAGSEQLETTRPYYRSGYVFVSRRDRHIHVASLSDASLENYRIGAQIIGDDGETVPPAQVLARRGLARNIVAFSLYGDPLSQNPAADIIDAVAQGKVDVAVAWGPMAGYFASHSRVPLELTSIATLSGPAALPMEFSISMGVRKGDDRLRDELNQFIVRHRADIQHLLENYGVPLLDQEDTRADLRVGCEDGSSARGSCR
jgi:mxaJ protein